MTREIVKFRAWDIANQKFTFWTMNDLCTWDTKDEKPSALDEWQQFTDLKDKNGVEIYEGDIVKHFLSEKRVGEVFYHHASFMFRGIGTNPEMPYWDDMEVIGNIYQNPELLK